MAELEIKPTRAAMARVSAVIVVALGITGVLVFLLSGGGLDSFTPKVALTTYMPDATGLQRNSEVRLGGIRIGKVARVSISGYLDPQRSVRVDMKIVARFRPAVPRDSQTSIGADTLVGYKFVDIAPGKDPLQIADNSVLKSEPLQRADERADLIRTFQNELRDADNILIQISSPNTTLGHLVMGDKEYRDFLQKVSAFDAAMHTAISPEGPIGNALFMDTAYRSFHDPLVKADETLAAIQRGEGAGGRLYASDTQYLDVLRSLHEIRVILADLNAGKGAFGALLVDDAASAKVSTMLRSVDRSIASLAAGELFNNPKLYEQVNGSVKDLKAFLEDLRTNPRKYLRLKLR